MPKKLFACFAALVLTLYAIALVPQPANAQADNPNITVVHISIIPGSGLNRSSLGYAPDVVRLVIGVNNTVVWTNDDNVTHTVTSTKGVFDSGLMAPGQSWNYTFKYPGTFDYYCTLHPWMKGEVIVELPAGSTVSSNYTLTQLYSSGAPLPNNPPGNIIAAAVFALLIIGLILGEISARKTR